MAVWDSGSVADGAMVAESWSPALQKTLKIAWVDGWEGV